MARRPAPLFLVPPLIFLGLVAAFYFGMQRGDPSQLPSAFIGKPAPSVGAEVLPGTPELGEGGLTNGQITLVNFWASWCPPCRAEHPQLSELAAEGVRIVGVNFNDAEAAAVSYLAKYGNPFAAVPYDPQGRTSFDWGVAAPPETFIVAADGTVLYKFIGPLVGSDYRQRFLPELQKARAAE